MNKKEDLYLIAMMFACTVILRLLGAKGVFYLKCDIIRSGHGEDPWPPGTEYFNSLS